jgi:predicted esterase YcpF (UPF0227 family)
MIFYIHGYNSDGIETASKILSGLKDIAEVKVIQYNFNDADKGHADIKNQLRPYIDEDILLVGSSLGGFWTNFFASAYNYRCVLINPAIKPHVSLKKYQVETDSYVKYETDSPKNEIYRALILGMKDDVIDPVETLNYYTPTKPRIFTFPGEGHRFTDFSPINTIIRKVYNTYY